MFENVLFWTLLLFIYYTLISDHNLACTDIYHARLQERNFVKELIHEYQLMDKYYFAKEKTKRKLSVDEKYVDQVIIPGANPIFILYLHFLFYCIKIKKSYFSVICFLVQISFV